MSPSNAFTGQPTATVAPPTRPVDARALLGDVLVDDPLAHPGHAHLVGIGGSGMRSLAALLADAGWRISGSDAQPVALPTADHWNLPIRCHAGHSPEQVPATAELVIYSSAVAEQNCERVAARELGIPQFSYPQILGRLQAGRMGIGVAGTHGKSTTTAMLANILITAGADPTVVLGAVPLGAASGARLGAGEFALVEACEFQRNFLQLNCQAALVLNVEWDHCETYPQLGEVFDAFASFAGRLPADGLLVVNQDCPVARRLCRDAPARCVTFGATPTAGWHAASVGIYRGAYRFRIVAGTRVLTEVCLRLPGRHNLHNALGAAALAAELGMPATAIRRGLEHFNGLQRRCQALGTYAGVTLVDDYAHHPTEIRATLAAIRGQYPGRRLWCVFQPHQAVRTIAMLDEFAVSLQNADAVLVADIYRARESEPCGISSQDLAARIARGPRIREAILNHNELVERLAAAVAPGDIVVACGAGDIGKVLHGLRERL